MFRHSRLILTFVWNSLQLLDRYQYINGGGRWVTKYKLKGVYCSVFTVMDVVFNIHVFFVSLSLNNLKALESPFNVIRYVWWIKN